MADAVVSVVMEQAVSFLAQKIEENVQLVVGTKKEVKKLSKTLGTIKKVLTDAEKKEVKDGSVRDWLERLKDVSYNAEDVLDEWNTAILKAQNENTTSGGPKSNKVCSCFPSPSFRFGQICLRHKIGSKIKDIRETLDEIANEKKQFDFIPNGSVEEPDRLKTTSLIDVTEVCGRKMDKVTIVNKLLCESSQGERGLHIISIVGLGGIGKTTLAQLAYNDDEVKAHFDKRIWVCVSDPFDQMSIARSILEALNGSAVQNFRDLEIPLQQIQDSIMGKKLLLVLDDVWTEDSKKWEPLKLSLKCSGRGSRILVTTRNERVAKVMETTDMLHLEKLSEEDCWLLFRQIAFLGKGREECEKLEDIGKKIANKCKGLPLAAKTLGGLMQFKETKQDWENVLNSETWELEEVENDLFRPLLLSYYSLPSPVKCCFTYCAIFPKDFVIEKDDLIQLWMAQGFLSLKGNIDMETNGEKYFNNLVMRSFFQDFTKDKRGNIIRCKMHDIVHDFAQFLTNNECSIMEIDDERELSLKSPFNKVRHSNIMFQNFDTNTNFPPSIYEAKNLRTLRVQATRYDTLIPSISFDSFMCLRMLNIYHCGIKDLPSTIGKLIHLRYLNISSNPKLKKLPETLFDLYNLQTLKLNDCYDLHKLPQGMRKLINLRHLEVERCFGLTMPKGMGEMRFLRTLSAFVISDDSVDGEGCKLGELKNLNHLKGFLSLTGLQKVTNVGEAVEAKLNEKKLHSLELKFPKDYVKLKEDVIEVEALVIEALHPHPDLELLMIDAYAGARFPSWLITLPNLKRLRLSGCRICEHLPPLGKLPSLERLHINWLPDLKSFGREFLRIGLQNDRDKTSQVTVFPKLQELTLARLGELEEWVDPTGMRQGEEEDSSIIIMPNLLSLEIEDCDKLGACRFPSWMISLPNLKCLRLSGCRIWEHLPPLWKLPSLETLHLGLLHNLKSLGHEFLGIGGLNDHDAYETSQVTVFPKLKELTLIRLDELEEWVDPTRKRQGEEGDSSIMIMPNLLSLTIKNCNKLKARFPSWMISLPNLKHLELYGCIIWEHLPPLWRLPSLERLRIGGLPNLKSLGHEFLGIGQLNDHDKTSQVTVFPKLQELTFDYLDELEEWVDPTRKRQGGGGEDSSIIIMPNLLSLNIQNCKKLKALPDYVLKTPLRQLSICSDILYHRYKEQVGEDWKKISHIPTVSITEPEDINADDEWSDWYDWW